MAWLAREISWLLNLGFIVDSGCIWRASGEQPRTCERGDKQTATVSERTKRDERNGDREGGREKEKTVTERCFSRQRTPVVISQTS